MKTSSHIDSDDEVQQLVALACRRTERARHPAVALAHRGLPPDQRAALAGLSVIPPSQVIEVEAPRRAPWHELFLDGTHLQLLLRVRWQELTRPPLPRVPRRPLADVLDPH